MVKSIKMFTERKVFSENVSYNGGKGITTQHKDDKPNDDSSVSTIWQNFRDTTGFHGVNKFSFRPTSPRTTIRSLCWISIWMASAIYLILTVSKELKSYYSFPTISNTYIQFDEKLEFPAITVCNLNPWKKSSFKNDSKTENLGLARSLMSQFSQKINWSDPFYTSEGYFEGRTMDNITAESKKLSEFVYFTLFDNQYLPNLFKPVITDVGLCLRGNADGQIETEVYGAIFNLQMFINAKVDEDYFSSFLSSGIKIAVHDHLAEPVMVNEGFAIKPASEAFIEIQRKKNKFLPPPYFAFGHVQCVDRVNYSVSRCYWDCWIKQINDRCGCKSFMAELQDDENENYITDHPSAVNANNAGQCSQSCSRLYQVGHRGKQSRMLLRLCQYSKQIYICTGNETYCSLYKLMNCTTTVFWESVTASKVKCHCPLKCEYTTYDYTLSTGRYPSEYLVSTISNFTNFSASYIRSNFIYVKIYYKDLTTTVTEQVPKYENVGAIFANLGGQLGLFLGASVLTVTELMEFILFLAWHVFTKYRNRQINNSSNRTIVVRESNF